MTGCREDAAAPEARDEGVGVRGRAALGAMCALLVLALLLFMLGPGGASARVIGAPAGADPAAVPPALGAPLSTPYKAARLDSALAELAAVSRSRGRAAGARYAAVHDLDLGRDGAQVLIVARDARRGSLALVRRAVSRCGGEVLTSYRELVSARVPVGRLAGLATCAGVLAVQVSERGVPDAVSEGVADMGADVWQAAGMDGSGVKVGIVDAGFKGYQALLGSELPDAVTVWGRGSEGVEGVADTDAHGTSVAEVIHDVAPGAELYLARPLSAAEAGERGRLAARPGCDGHQPVDVTLRLRQQRHRCDQRDRRRGRRRRRVLGQQRRQLQAGALDG